jgi:CubicO group peptidase (beta-lactamase class C family)
MKWRHAAWVFGIIGMATSAIGQPAAPSSLPTTVPVIDRGPWVDAAVIEKLVQDGMDRSGAPSYVVGIVSRDGLVYAKAFGLADIAQNRAATVDTIYQIGSVTKTFTATLMCILRDEGKLNLHDPAAKYLPGNVSLPTDPRGAPAITFWHLATHTSGLPVHPVNRRDVPDSPSVMLPYSVEELYLGLNRTGLIAPVGTRFQYSNLGMGLLGNLLERAERKPYEQLLQRRLLEPLGMNSTRITLTQDDLNRFATHYWAGDASQQPRERWIFGEVCGFGGITSTVPDLAKYVVMFIRCGEVESVQGPVVRGASLREMCTAQFITSPRWRMAQGLGWQIQHLDDDQELITHGGEVDGNAAHVVFSLQQGVGLIVLCNTGRDAAGLVAEPLMQQIVRNLASQRAGALELYRQQKYAEAAQAMSGPLQRVPADAELWTLLGQASLELNANQRAAEAFERAAQLSRDRATSLYNAACGWAKAGKSDDAFRCLGAAIANGFRGREHAETDSDLASLRTDPRWSELFLAPSK